MRRYDRHHSARFGKSFRVAQAETKAPSLVSRPYEGARAVLLPRRDARSMRVADELRSAGIADLGAHLAALCARQNVQGDGEESLFCDGSV